VTDVIRCADDLHRQIDAMVTFAEKCSGDANRHASLKDMLGGFYAARARAHGCHLTTERILGLLAMDIELNAQGLEVWIDKQLGKQR
jgi:hypothetical protein